MKKIGFFLLALVLIPHVLCAEDSEKAAMKTELTQLREANEKLRTEIQEVKADRENILKQTKVFMAEKEEMAAKLKNMQTSGGEASNELKSLKKEIETLRSDLLKEKNARLKDRQLHQEELHAREKALADLEAQKNSLAASMKEFTPEKIQAMKEDRNRLEIENKQMALRLLEADKKMQEMRIQAKPLELDREEAYRLREENKDLQRRAKYVDELESRQKQLIRENAEYREKVEVLKGKFKDAVPGLAKSSRISQKMMQENADMHYNLGTIFLKNKQYKEAIKEFERVLELRPSDSDTHYNLGVLYDDYLKDREKALYHYQKYLAINPKAADAKKVETYILSLELEQKVR